MTGNARLWAEIAELARRVGWGFEEVIGLEHWVRHRMLAELQRAEV
jgi:hypothetical protein